MSDLRVTIERLEVFGHPNADALELAQVGLYRAVVPKGVYKSGDYALYIPEQAVLPPELIEELGLTGRLAGPEKNRVKAIRLRGELSQGIVCRPKGLPIDSTWRFPKPLLDIGQEWEDIDYAPMLGITKWVPPIPVGMAGQVEPAPNLIRWIEIENIKRYPTIFEPGEMVVATEKIHGTCCLVTVDFADGPSAEPHVYVSSKGVGANHLAIKRDERNLYWRAVKQYNLTGLGSFLSGYLGSSRVGIFGEVYGRGVQDLHYGADASRNETLGFAIFDIAYIDDATGERAWLSPKTLTESWDLPTDSGVPSLVPLVYQGPYDYALLNAFANIRESVLDPGTLREGIVVRPMTERYSDVLGGRAIAKFVSEAYLERKGATEYE